MTPTEINDRMSGKIVDFKNYKNARQCVRIIDSKRCKTYQPEITGWIKIDPDLTQKEVDIETIRSKRKIRERIKNLAKQTQLFHPESIVEIKIGQINDVNKRTGRIFVAINIVIYNISQIYDKSIPNMILRPFLKDIVDYDLDQNVFQWIIKPKRIRKNK